MAGSLQRPPFKIIIPLHKCNTSNDNKNKSIIKKYQIQRLLHTKRRQQQQNCNKIVENNNISNNSQNPRQFKQLKTLKKLKYCQSLSWNKLLSLLLPSSLSLSAALPSTSAFTSPPLASSSLTKLFSNDSCWTATENKKNYYKILLTAAINYVQQQVQQQKQQPKQQLQKQQQQQQQQQHQHQQQHLQLQLQLLQILNKVFKSSKFCKNLLNRKKLQQFKLRQKQFYRENQLYEKSF